MKSDPIPVSCPYTVRVAGPVKPIPNDAPFLPIRVREKLKRATY